MAGHLLCIWGASEGKIQHLWPPGKLCWSERQKQTSEINVFSIVSCPFAQAALGTPTEWGTLNNSHSFSPNPGGYQSQIKVSAGPVSPLQLVDSHLLPFYMACPLRLPHLSYRMPAIWTRGHPYDHLFKGPVSKKSYFKV